ncbi:ATP-grasp domain-containing protein [Ponticaulis profundi]|uniref:RimK family alpha-L-glutamate ligase n=1 Tax=Ponticaulis profundi TaxID=2665222 RepID=A0ABW1SA09_9PROT
MKIAYLACKSTLPDSPNRRVDAFEHDLSVQALGEPLTSLGHQFVPIDWNAPNVNWASFDAVVIGTTWDYWDDPQNFLKRLREIEALGVPVFNSADIVAWNLKKTYLRELAEKGAATIPTLWLSKPSAADVEHAFDHFQSDRLVVKRQVGAGAQDQLFLKRGDPQTDYPFDAMVQPFLTSIQTEGEISVIMIDGAFSHAVLKQATGGDYRIQSSYGGKESRIDGTRSELLRSSQIEAKSVLDLLDFSPLYARVDLVRGDDDQLKLMELELIEPYLYPEQSDGLGEMFVRALLGRMN